MSNGIERTDPSNEFLLEVGVEELPTTEVDGIIQQLNDAVQERLKSDGLGFDEFRIILAPRRFGFFLRGLPDRTPDKVVERRGPSVSVAFNADGSPTKALAGFLRSNDSSIEDVKIVDGYVYVSKLVPGVDTGQYVAKLAHEVIEGLRFKKPMRWGSGHFEFVRIPHHLLAIYNGEPVELELFGMRASNQTVGHRFVKDEYFCVSGIEDYLEKLKDFYVVPLLEQRIEMIESQLREFERTAYKVDWDDGLIREVAMLTEYPKLIVGTFDTRFLHLPEELIRTTIKHHQRSFTTRAAAKLTNTFVAFIDKPEDVGDNARKGYERVVNARLEDARYYYERDLNSRLEDFNEKLKEIVFQKELGTLYDKVLRIVELSRSISEQLGLSKIHDRILRTALLCKADIGSNVVYEFPELQGVMGRIYALKDGEPEDIAFGIEEHYSHSPNTVTGAVVGVADRVDTIVGNFIIGNVPTGSKDPYGLRSKADDIFSIVEKFEWKLDIRALIQQAAKLIGRECPEALFEFFENRFELYNARYRFDVARAVKHLWGEPIRGILSAEAIAGLLGSENFEHLIVGFERVHNITRKHELRKFDAAKFIEEEERELFERYLEVKPRVLDALRRLNYREALEELIKLRKAIDSYFDKVFVMSELEDVRLNRLSFLKNLDDLFMQVADLSQIERYAK